MTERLSNECGERRKSPFCLQGIAGYISTNNTEKLFRVICFVWYMMHFSVIKLLFVSHLPVLHFTPSLSHPPLSASSSMFHEWILAILRSGSVWSSRVQHDSIMYYLHKSSFRLATICSVPVTWLKIGLCKSVGLGDCALHVLTMCAIVRWGWYSTSLHTSFLGSEISLADFGKLCGNMVCYFVNGLLWLHVYVETDLYTQDAPGSKYLCFQLPLCNC